MTDFDTNKVIVKAFFTNQGYFIRATIGQINILHFANEYKIIPKRYYGVG